MDKTLAKLQASNVPVELKPDVAAPLVEAGLIRRHTRIIKSLKLRPKWITGYVLTEQGIEEVKR